MGFRARIALGPIPTGEELYETYDSLRFQTRDDGVHVEYYVSPSRKLAYMAHETEPPYGRYRAAFRFTDTKCAIWSDAIDDTAPVARIYKGDVRLAYRNLSAHKQYQLVEDGESYKIASIKPDGSVAPVYYNSEYFLPINFDLMAWQDDGSRPIQDDREYLVSPFFAGFCAEKKGAESNAPSSSPEPAASYAPGQKDVAAAPVDEVDEALISQFNFITGRARAAAKKSRTY